MRYAYDLKTASYFPLTEDVVLVTVPESDDDDFAGEFLASADTAGLPSLASQMAAGGFDGVLVTFGEGTDDDTLNASIFHYGMVQLTLREGSVIEASEPRAIWSEDPIVIEYQAVTEDEGQPTGGRTTVPFEQLVAVHIY